MRFNSFLVDFIGIVCPASVLLMLFLLFLSFSLSVCLSFFRIPRIECLSLVFDRLNFNLK